MYIGQQLDTLKTSLMGKTIESRRHHLKCYVKLGYDVTRRPVSRDRNALILDSIQVEKEYRGSGMFTAFLSEVEEYCEKNKLVLCVNNVIVHVDDEGKVLDRRFADFFIEREYDRYENNWVQESFCRRYV
jgi:GNAT superfamily N-acetyltransferase